MMRRLTRTLFGRLVLIHLATLAGFIAALVLAVGIAVGERDPDVMTERLVDYVLERLGSPPDGAELDRLATALAVDIAVVGPDGWSWQSSPSLPAPAVLRDAARGVADRNTAFRHVDGRGLAVRRRGDWVFFAFRQHPPLGPRALVGLALGLLGLGAVAYGNYRAVRWLFAPIRQVQAGAERIGNGALDYRVDSRRRDEMGDLAQAVNGMADKLQATLEAKRQLLLAISHELRTPLTKATLIAEMMGPEDKRARLSAVLKEINSLVGALLEAEAVSDRHLALHLTEEDVGALLDEALSPFPPDRLRPSVPAGCPPLRADRLRIVLAVRNLVTNALRHGGEERPVEVTATPGPESLRIAIQDHGPGVAPEHLAHLGDAFYRPDAARQRQTGRHGLGLYLTRRIAESHGGRLELVSPPGQGLTATLVLPWAPA